MSARRTALAALAALVAAALLAPASAPAAFGLKDLAVSFEEEDGSEARQAGSHPYAFVTSFGFNTVVDPELGFEVPDGSPRDLTITAVPGLAGKPAATPRCTTLQFTEEACSAASQVGETTVTFGDLNTKETAPVYNIVPPLGVAAKLGFHIAKVPVTLDAGVNPDPPYNILARLSNISQTVPVYGATTKIWGKPAGPGEQPFLTAPRACEGPLQTFFRARSWEQPGTLLGGEAITPGFGGCEKLGFSPRFDAQATSKAASAPSGIDIGIEIENEGLANPEGYADSDIKKIELTLPEGMTANPSLAEGLSTCSPAAYAAESLSSGPGGGCPAASKIGSLEAETPLLEDEVLKGQIFIASQGDNPFGTLLALYVVVKHPGLGILVKLAGKVEPDPLTGQLTATFGEPGHELPQFPLSSVRTHLREGGRSPLITPRLCGTYTARALFTPWANPAATLPADAGFEVEAGPGGGPCPAPGTPPFEPGFAAGTLNNAAGSHSPFHMRLTRRDGDQDLTRFSAELPPGVVAKLAGVSRCPDGQIAAARARSGREEMAAPSCPAGSQIGSVIGGAGVGAQLTYVPGALYLAGPYNGAPLSVVAIVPAVAGPFDVGTVVTRQALRIDPRTAVVRADGSASDPIPHILAGIPLAVREIRVDVDRPDFTLNPTDCEPFQTVAELWGGGADVFGSGDDVSLLRSARFQAANCARLGFAPRLGLRLRGGTRRGAFPALRFHYRPRPGEANLERLALRFPRSEFIEQGHFRTICTRVQFAAGAGGGSSCPRGSIYGRVRAYTPLLEEPFTGPVFLRSSNNNLPDAVLALKGPPDFPLEVEVATRIDSVRGGLRAVAQGIPDVPVSRVLLDMRGGQKGLFVNSRDICRGKNRASARLNGQNGRRATLKPVLRASGCAQKKRRHSRHRRG